MRESGDSTGIMLSRRENVASVTVVTGSVGELCEAAVVLAAGEMAGEMAGVAACVSLISVMVIAAASCIRDRFTGGTMDSSASL